MALNGTNFIILEGNTPIGHSTNCSMTLNMDLPEKTTKDSNGWVEVMPGIKSGELLVDGLVDYSDVLNFESLADRIITRQRHIYVFNIGDYFYYGDGFITSAEQVADAENVTTFSINIKITNVLVSDNHLPWNLIDEIWQGINSQWQAT